MIRPSVIAHLTQPEAQQPTLEGLRRYCPTGEFDGSPCVCTSLCTQDCEGECGCLACQKAALELVGA